MASDELCYMTATEAIERFRARTLSPVELVSAVIARSEAVNPKVNAYTYTYTFYDRALEQARAAERAYASGAEMRPLEGVPVVIKDFHPVKGEITTFGSRRFVDHVPEVSAPTVERLLDAGAIMHARTTTPEMAHAGHTHSALWGITRNPWNLEFAPGGSSGGAGAAIATGMTHAGRRHRRRRFDPHPGGRLRDLRLQAALRPQSDRPRPSARIPSALWPDDPQRGRRRADAEHDGGPPRCWCSPSSWRC